MISGLLPHLQAALRQRYTIERELGHGGMAFVYLARDHKHDRNVAIKVLRPDLAAALGPERFLREIQIAAGLAHPHILPVHDSGQAGELLYYVMPYVEGESLRLRMNREHQLPLDDVLQIAREVAGALSYAHSRDIVHRDIKPENILLAGGHALVADFGVARAITVAVSDRLTGSGFAVGTPAYMSPEQAANEPVDGRTDIYSLGCVLYEMLAGDPPFPGSSGRVTPQLRTVRQAVPKQLERAVHRAIAKQAADRFATAGEFLAALKAARASGRRPPVSVRRAHVALVLAIVTALGGVVAIRVARSRAADRSATSELGTLTESRVAAEHLRKGQARFWAGDLDAATAAYRAAIEADSDLALAYHRLSVTQTWQSDYPAARRAVEAGLARSDRFSPHWRQLLEAQRYYVMRYADSAIAGFQALVVDHPRMADAWYGLGESLYHFAGIAGHEPIDADNVFEHLIGLDSTFAPIYDHLVGLALYQQNASKARAFLRHIRAEDDTRPAAEAAFALTFGDSSARTLTMRSLRDADRPTLSLLVVHFGHAGVNLPLVDTLGQYLMRADHTPDDRLRGAQYRLVALAGQARWEEALAAWTSAGGGEPFDRWMVLAYLAGFPSKKTVEPMFAWARSLVAHREIPDFTRAPWELPQQAFRGLVHRASVEGDSADALSLLRRLDAAAGGADASDPMPEALRAALRSRLALLAGDTTEGMRFLRLSVSHSAEPLGTFFPLMAMGPERWLLAEISAARGDRRQANRWLASFENVWSLGDVLYLRRVACVRRRLEIGNKREPTSRESDCVSSKPPRQGGSDVDRERFGRNLSRSKRGQDQEEVEVEVGRAGEHRRILHAGNVRVRFSSEDGVYLQSHEGVRAPGGSGPSSGDQARQRCVGCPRG